MARLKAASSLDPVCRLLCLVLFSSASLVMVPVLACIFIALLLILIYGEGIAPARIAREALFIVGLVSFTFVLQGVSVHPSLRLDPAGMLDAGVDIG